MEKINNVILFGCIPDNIIDQNKIDENDSMKRSTPLNADGFLKYLLENSEFNHSIVMS